LSLNLERFQRSPVPAPGTAPNIWSSVPVAGGPERSPAGAASAHDSAPSAGPEPAPSPGSEPVLGPATPAGGLRGRQLPAADLAAAFDSRGPVVDLDAFRALVAAHARRRHLRPRDVPRFDGLLEAGLVDKRGRLTSNGKLVVEMVLLAEHRVVLQAPDPARPLAFQAHVLGGRVLILTETAGEAPAPEGDPAAGVQVALDFRSRTELASSMAQWARLAWNAAPPRDPELRLDWEQVQEQFVHGAAGAAGGPHSGIWSSPWAGWAMIVDDRAPQIVVVTIGVHAYSLTRPDQDTALLTWVPAADLWSEIQLGLEPVVAEVNRPAPVSTPPSGSARIR